MPDPLGELRARLREIEEENARLRVMMANRLEWDDTTPPILNAPVHRYAGSPACVRCDGGVVAGDVLCIKCGGELREKLRHLEMENERLSASMDDIAELHRRIVQPIIEAESRAIVEYERRDRGDETEPYGLSVMELEARYLEARKRLWRANMDAHAGDEDEPVRCIHCKRPMDPERDGPKLAPVCADCRPKHGESPITTALRHAQEAVRLLEELPAVRAAWDAQDEILEPRRRMWEAQSSVDDLVAPEVKVTDPRIVIEPKGQGGSIMEEEQPRQAQKNVRDAAQGRP